MFLFPLFCTSNPIFFKAVLTKTTTKNCRHGLHCLGLGGRGQLAPRIESLNDKKKIYYLRLSGLRTLRHVNAKIGGQTLLQ